MAGLPRRRRNRHIPPFAPDLPSVVPYSTFIVPDARNTRRGIEPINWESLHMLDTPTTPTVPPDAQLPLRLVVPRDLALREVENQIKIGRAIKDQRIKNGWELDHARAEKQEWVVRTTELLKRLFTDGSIADEVNDWTAAILPEYAAFGEFVALFQDEMKHRLG